MGVTEKFLKYVSFDTSSDENSNTHPSTKKQLILASYISDEMKKAGMNNVKVDDNGYVYGYLEATEGCENVPCMGLIAHMDTSPETSGKDVKPRIVKNYDGNDIILNEEKNIVMHVSEYPQLSLFKGQDLIVTDGTTLLGADDKAGIAEIMSAVEFVSEHDEIKHGRIAIAFTPDEEIGQGADFFDVKGFGAEYAYTFDGGIIGELQYENFNAAAAKVTVHGINIHPGEAKNKMKNSMLMANDFLSAMPQFETPSNTEKYEGFYHITNMTGTVEQTTMSFIIRDHDRYIFNGRKEFMKNLIEKMNSKYGEGSFELDMKDSYYNMKDMIMPHMDIVDKAGEAMKECGIMPIIEPIRGGTDGARLSYMGLPCPNLSTGGLNFHGRFEYIPVQSLEKMFSVAVKLIEIK